MKKFSYKRWLSGLALVAGLVACDDDFEKLNSDPDNAKDVPSAYLLTGGEYEMMSVLHDEWNQGRFGMLWAQYWTQQEYTNESRYKLRDGSIGNLWRDMYAGSMMDLTTVIKKEETPNYVAIATLVRAWNMQVVTDIWGDAPFKEAFQLGDNLTPAYDTQESIYTTLLADVKSAHDMLDASGAAVKGDVIYGGDIAKWKKFANVLRMRLALRMADVNEATAKSIFAEASSASIFAGNDEEASLVFEDNAANANPLSFNLGGRGQNDFAFSDTFVNYLKSMDDPRLMSFAPKAKKEGVGYAGRPFGQLESVAQAEKTELYSSGLGPKHKYTMPAVLLSYSEQEFMLAEAVERGFIAGSAEDHFKKAVQASMDYWEVPAADAKTYMDNLTYNASDWKKSIGTQKWIALYNQNAQGWIEWRRLDFGIFKMPAGGIHENALSDVIPTRLRYPLTEDDLNEANLKASLSTSGYGEDRQDKKVWWDVN
ncbi:hypothetical protein FUAX_32030 [Fulvitalea axinellae]|uniref:SusD/RagB family nutrient-binding outer membrane lipoprotein n=1 Tax=Fulvitalea axinellae TaxID=1182444 RepID=A0AAU9CNR4_9BACT|nr:hypothetical protein FUAX_32030 [Fulvitalea axinellae]